MDRSASPRDQLTCPWSALKYEEAVKRRLLLDILELMGVDVRLTSNGYGYSINYVDGNKECSTAVGEDDMVQWLRSLLMRKIDERKPRKKRKGT